jgi:hypothetical protein
MFSVRYEASTRAATLRVIGLMKNGTGAFLIPAGRQHVSLRQRWHGITVNEKADHEQRHKAALGVVHVVSPSHPFLGFGTQLAFLAGRVSLWNQRLAKVIDEILHDGSRFSDD